MLQQDSHPEHVCGWDLEPIWDYTKRKKDSRRPAATKDLRLVLHDVENNLVGKILHKLSASKN